MNKKSPRIHREALPTDLARPLLNVPAGVEGYSVWDRLEAARAALREAVAQANHELAGNPLMEILAEHAMRQVGKRGYPQVVVDPDGSVLLEVHYDASPKEEEAKAEAEEGKRKSTLPSIAFLRAEAEGLGIDHAPFGKNKTRLLKTIEAARHGNTKPTLTAALKAKQKPAPPAEGSAPVVAAVPEPPVKPKMMKTAPALTSAKVVQPDSIKAIPDDEDDLTALFGGPGEAPVAATPPLPRRGVPLAVASTPAKKVGGRSLSDLVSKAPQEVDIEAILAKGAPSSSPPKD